ncbi:Protein DOS2 [Candida viswanathii]|uniref:Protein DOS2 n=1 Tax=Candida viswanathii TaxID=5486 RepID=A0A367YBJ5_9ASCO|nr:Protein DOS2 [Candida viswanathii]
MDYIDPAIVQESEEPNIKPTTDETTPVSHDAATVKTEETIEKLETEIDKAYGLVETKFLELWSNASQNIDKIKIEEQKQKLIDQLNNTKKALNERTNELHVQENLRKIEENLKQASLGDFSKSANKALDLLDSKLEIVENEASKYFGNFTSFLSSMVSVTLGTEEEGGEKKEVLFNSSLNQYNNYGTTRYDNDLLNLHTTEDFYLSEDLDVAGEVNAFNADDKTKEISGLLEKYPTTLTKTMNELVPVKISYNLFWYRYFKNDDKLKEQEKKRKELLEKKDDSKKSGSQEGDDDEEDFTWDDEDEEDEETTVDSKKSDTKKESKKKEDTNGGTASKEEVDAEDEEEDDWE